MNNRYTLYNLLILLDEKKHIFVKNPLGINRFHVCMNLLLQEYLPIIRFLYFLVEKGPKITLTYRSTYSNAELLKRWKEAVTSEKVIYKDRIFKLLFARINCK
jgi:hypothetical protein